MTRRRKRRILKNLHCYILPESYLYISAYLGEESSLGASIDQIVREHKSKSNATTSLPVVDKTKLIQ